MKIKQHRPRQIVGTFLRGKSPIQGETIREVATNLNAQYRGGSIAQIESLLYGAVKGQRLWKYQEGGISFYEPKKAKRRREILTRNSASTEVAQESEVVLA